MKTVLLSLSMVLVLGGLSSCEQNSLEQEVDDYCDCTKDASNESDTQVCREQLQEILDKYSFDPEASELIEKRLADCVSN